MDIKPATVCYSEPIPNWSVSPWHGGCIVARRMELELTVEPPLPGPVPNAEHSGLAGALAWSGGYGPRVG